MCGQADLRNSQSCYPVRVGWECVLLMLNYDFTMSKIVTMLIINTVEVSDDFEYSTSLRECVDDLCNSTWACQCCEKRMWKRQIGHVYIYRSYHWDLIVYICTHNINRTKVRSRYNLLYAHRWKLCVVDDSLCHDDTNKVKGYWLVTCSTVYSMIMSYMIQDGTYV